MKVVAPTALMVEAAALLEPIRDDVVVIGAVAVQVALAGHDVLLTPTRDIDAWATADVIERVVAHLEQEGLRPSTEEHERSFTWVKGDIRIQLLRPFHPFPKGAARGLPVNNMLSELDAFREIVAFADDPTCPRFWVASPAALVGLKEMAFGRTRHSGEPVDRDFSDVALLLDRLGDEIVAEVAGSFAMRGRVRRAGERLASDDVAIASAARELVGSGQEDTQLAAEVAVRRGARRFLRRLGAANDTAGV